MKKYITILIISLFFLGCKKDKEDFENFKKGNFNIVDWEPTIVAPLVNTRSTLGEMYESFSNEIEELEEEGFYLSINDEGLFVISFKEEIHTDGLNDYYKIPEESDGYNYTIPPEAVALISLLPPGQSLPSVDTTILFDIDPEYSALLEYIELSDGLISMEFDHNTGQDIEVSVEIESLTNQGTNNPVSFNFNTSPSAKEEILDNHLMDLTHLDPMTNLLTYNKLKVKVTIGMTKSNLPVLGDQINLKFTVREDHIDYVQGYLGTFGVPLPSGSFDIDIFDDIDLKGIYFKEPSMQFDIESTAGVPLELLVDTLDFGYADDVTESLDWDVETVTINSVNTRGDIPNSPALSSFTIDHTNSRLEDLLTTEPNNITYALDVLATDSTNPDRFKFFLEDTSFVKANITAELPLDFSVLEYLYQDTIFFDDDTFDDETDSLVEYMERAELKIIFENQFPFDIEVEAYLTDSNGVVLASVFDDTPHTVLANKNVNADGVAEKPNDIETLVVLNKEKFKHVLNTSYISYVVRGKTSNAISSEIRYVKLKSDYTFGVRIGLLAKLKVDLDEIIESEQE